MNSNSSKAVRPRGGAHDRLRLLTPLVICLATLAAPSAARAQFLPPGGLVQNPTAPVPVSPVGNPTLTRPDAMSPLSFVWRQYGLFSMPGQPPLPSLFVICLKPASDTTPCAWPLTTTAGTYTATAGSTNTGIFYGANFTPLGYQHALPVISVPDGVVDVQAKWIVGACRAAATSACTFAQPQQIWISTKDLKAENTTRQITSAGITVTTFGSYAGASNSGAFRARVTMWEVLTDASWNCRKDANAADVINDPSVLAIFNDGRIEWLSQLPRPGGVIDTTNLVGMHRYGVMPPPPGTSVNVTPGLSPTTLPVPLIRDFFVAVAASQRPKGFASVAELDTNNTVREFNEKNNARAECYVLKP
jgi:hypothetical protein